MRKDKKEMPVFDPDKCNDCGLCVSVCVCGGFIFIEKEVCICIDADCDDCQQCEIVCPTGAISFPFEIVDES
jgi:NAD-dependent dihydropyrimidine dehydrogenase PreA subunit